MESFETVKPYGLLLSRNSSSRSDLERLNQMILRTFNWNNVRSYVFMCLHLPFSQIELVHWARHSGRKLQEPGTSHAFNAQTVDLSDFSYFLYALVAGYVVSLLFLFVEMSVACHVLRITLQNKCAL